MSSGSAMSKALAQIMGSYAESLHRKALSVVDPETGKHVPVFSAADRPEKWSLHTNESPAFARALEHRLGLNSGDIKNVSQPTSQHRRVYLAHAWEDKPISADELLLTKALDPLSAEHAARLEEIEKLDVSDFTEAEVRFSVIDPIIRILGYDKGTNFSANLERPLKFRRTRRFPDYQLTIWEENFWIIEAKKPRKGLSGFSDKDIAQVIEYSVHPDVNAALVVLCDGINIEIYDREVSVEKPMLHVQRADLRRDFDKLRAILEPIQIWFFQKRRIVRLLDKVFDREFNLSRVEEFGKLIEGRLQSKRGLILENFRNNVKPDSDQQVAQVAEAPPSDLVELYLFSLPSHPMANAVNRRLVSLCERNSFQVMHRIFPDHPRDATDIFMAQALTFLMGLGETRDTVEWMPAWLAGGNQVKASLETVTKFLLRQCLTYFEDYEPYRIILLAACSIRRIARIMAITNEAERKLAADMHVLARFHLPEIAWHQIVASPNGQLLGFIEAQTRAATLDFVKRSRGEHGELLTASAKLSLKTLWHHERSLLSSVANYAQLSAERNLGEMAMTEWSSVTYDNLGHSTLCLMHRFSAWKEFVVEHQKPLLENLAAMGSWAAKDLLGVPHRESYGSITDQQLADRFFLGDVSTLEALRAGYRRAP